MDAVNPLGRLLLLGRYRQAVPHVYPPDDEHAVVLLDLAVRFRLEPAFTR